MPYRGCVMLEQFIVELTGRHVDVFSAWLHVGLLLALLPLGVWIIYRKNINGLQRWLRLGIIFLMLLLAVGGYLRFGNFVSGFYLHHHDVAHYYFGSKYAEELGYTNIYRCIITADAEILAENGQKPSKAMRNFEVRNIETYRMTTVGAMLDDPRTAAPCKAGFSPPRWRQFKSDIRAFYPIQKLPYLYDRCGDMGYNGAPVWSVVAGAIANLTDVSEPELNVLASLDMALLALAFALFCWAFGLEIGLVALIFYLTVFFNYLHFIHGSFLRFDWMAFVLASMAFLKKKHYRTAGALLAYASVIRLFPMLLLTGPGLLLLRDARQYRKDNKTPAGLKGWWKALWAQKQLVHLFAAWLITAVLLSLLALGVMGLDYHRQYVTKMAIHKVQKTSTRIGFPYMIHLMDEHPLRATLGLVGGEGAKAALDRVISPEHQKNLLGYPLLLLLLAITVLAMLKLRDWEAAVYGYVPVFLLLGLTQYYCVVITIMLPVYLMGSPLRRSRITGWVLLLAMAPVSYAMFQWGVGSSLQSKVNSLILCLVLMIPAALIAMQDTVAQDVFGRMLAATGRWLRRHRLGVCIAVVLLALVSFAVTAGLWMSNPMPTAKTWQKAITAITETGYRPGRDLLVVTPQKARDDFPVELPGRVLFADRLSDTSFLPHRKVWVLSIPGTFKADVWDARPHVLNRNEIFSGGLLDKAIEMHEMAFTDSARSLYDFREHMKHARVYVEEDKRRRRCTDIRNNSHYCAQNNWNYVGPVSRQEDHAMRHMIWAHPVVDAMVVEFPQVPMGRYLLISHCLTDHAVTLKGGAPVVVEMWVGTEYLGKIIHKNRRGYRETLMDTGDYAGASKDVTLRISTSKQERRHFLFSGATVQ